MKNRTGVDFSEHILNTVKTDQAIIYDLKILNSNYKRVTFINSIGIMAVTGDYGNWIFCREFHPTPEEGVSDSYWIEKLQINSTQEAYDFDSEKTKKVLEEGIIKDLEEFGYDEVTLEEMKAYYLGGLDFVNYSEFEYASFIYNNMPSFLDAEYVPFEKSIKPWLLVIFDAFDEICIRMKEEKEKKQ